ncbi:MAG TPA: NAD(P)/FAD-dependent oxidoreductase, partial [Labilithrix sp.]|nr:NAD(P)/FAD-dependent oxidoreductase [Labilithrix sp.]
MSADRYDAVIAGAGIAGSACAAMLAAAGLRVAVVDGRSEEKVGARWVNAVPEQAFDDAGLARPEGAERCASGHRVVIASPSARVRLRFEEHGVVEVDMRLLGERLRRDARQAGVTFHFGDRMTGFEQERGRLRAVEAGGRTLRAPLFVDASGLPAALRRAVFPRWPSVARMHICTAAQAVFEIGDRAGTEEFLAREGMTSGEALARTGVAGGFSILNVRVDLEDGHVAVLTGSVQDEPARPNGTQLLDAFVAAQPWLGPRRFGGAGAIPLRRPYARLGSPGLALLGDAACMTFAVHGSGIATGLRAARALVDAVTSNAADPGSEKATWSYAARWHRELGGVLLAYDVVRRVTQRMSREELEE